MTEKNPIKSSEKFHKRDDSGSEMCFILGIKQRCGTNMLYALLELHPECRVLEPIWEDFMVHHSNFLENYVGRIYRIYKPRWNVKEKIGPPELLLNYFGDSIIRFLKLQNRNNIDRKTPALLITKTPSVKGLHNFFKLFPRSRLLILVRDGRSVVESGVKTFKWDFEGAIREWASAAKTIIDFQQKFPSHQYNYLIVNYENLVTHQEKELRKIFSFLNLNADKYDFDQAQSIKVVGSSEISKGENGEIHWRGSEKTTNFNPLNRWHIWDRFKHERFNWIAGEYLSLLGYTPKTFQSNSTFYNTWNVYLDLKLRRRSRKEFLKNILGFKSNSILKRN